jgi:hypothetical protein
MRLKIALLATCLLAVGFFASGTDVLLNIAHNDQVHFGGHLLAGRVLSLCPCTAELAETQYVRALPHARTPLQVALLTTQRPTGVKAQLRETPLLVHGLVRHVSRRLGATE